MEDLLDPLAVPRVRETCAWRGGAEGVVRGCCSSLLILNVEAGVPDPWTVTAGMAAVDSSAAGDTLAAVAEDAPEGMAADEPVVVGAVEALTAGVAAGVAAVVAAGVGSAAAAAISAAGGGATLPRRTCRTVTTTTAAIAAKARPSRARPHARMRLLGRSACAGKATASEGGATRTGESSADFTALEN